MKTKLLLLALTLGGALNLYAQHDHDHGKHSQAGEAPAAGPNGGKLFKSTEPHFELFMQDDRKVRVTFVDDDGKPADHAGASVSGIGGERSKPTRLSFEAVDGTYVSTEPLPEGNIVPLIVRVKPDASSKTVTERININLAKCGSCDYLEYACICGH